METAKPARFVKFFAAGMLLIVGALGCAASRPPLALEQARVAYLQAQQDPNVTTQAPLALHEADQTLRQAEQVWARDKDQEEAQHLAYLAERKVEVARATAQQKTAEADIQQLAEERERVLLESRARQLSKAERETEQARQDTQYARQEAQQATARATELQQELTDLKAKENERGWMLTLGDVLFEFNRADLRPGAMRSLYPLETFLKNHPERQVVIEGYTDSIGSEQYNLELSQRRAEAVRNFLVSNGISPDRIATRGYGKAYPVASNYTEGGRQENRRVEVTIVR